MPVKFPWPSVTLTHEGARVYVYCVPERKHMGWKFVNSRFGDTSQVCCTLGAGVGTVLLGEGLLEKKDIEALGHQH